MGNRVRATGGAIDSAAGQDYMISRLFVGNTTSMGGALRVAGTAYLDNCSFVENVSDVDRGAAVSNTGYSLSMRRISFIGNIFNCPPTIFVDYYAVSYTLCLTALVNYK